MITTTSLRDADIAFFPLQVPGKFFFQITLTIDKSYEMIGYNFLPIPLIDKLNLYSAQEPVTLWGRPLEFVCFRSEYPYYENLNTSEEYYSDCWDKIMDTATKRTRPVTCVLGPSTLLFNLSYAFSKEGLPVYRNTIKKSQKLFLISRKENPGRDLYRSFLISQVPVFRNLT